MTLAIGELPGFRAVQGWLRSGRRSIYSVRAAPIPWGVTVLHTVLLRQASQVEHSDIAADTEQNSCLIG